MTSEKKSEVSKYYKYSTIFLGVVIILISIWFGMNYLSGNYYQRGYNVGQNDFLNYIELNVNKTGYVEMQKNGEKIVLVHPQIVQDSQKEVVLKIMSEVNTKGYVVLYNESSELILVPYVEPENNVQ